MALEFVRQQVASQKVVIFSEVSCRYSKAVKKALQDLGCVYPADTAVYELDQLVDGPDLKRALEIITGQSTVPQVFIGAKYIGGADCIVDLERTGKLEEKLTNAGATLVTPDTISLCRQHADQIHREAQELNKQKEFGKATAKYKEYVLMNKKAEMMAKLLAANRPAKRTISTIEPPIFPVLPSQLHVPATAGGRKLVNARIQASIVAAVVSDAAAMGVQWVYDDDLRQELEATAIRGGACGLDFLDPPANIFFTYDSGRNSPYGEQALVLLKSLAENDGLHVQNYTRAFHDFFGGDWCGYRDASCSGFLSKFDEGFRYPDTGADDFQANCFTRVPALAALFAGHPHLEASVAAACVVTQGTPEAVAWGCLAARMLQHVLFGVHPMEAVVVAAETGLDANRLEASGVGVEVRRQAANLYPKCAGLISEVARRAKDCCRDVVSDLGMNCHIPNSFQTAVHAALHYAGLWDEGRTWAHPAQCLAACVRDTLKQGGCCASRATFAGALLAAYLAPWALREGGSGVPSEWEQKSVEAARARDYGRQICRVRQGSRARM